MVWNLQREDLLVIGGLLALPVVIASLTLFNEAWAMPLMLLTGKWVQVPAVVAGLVAIYLAQKPWEQDVGRALFLTGAGFAAILIIWTPHEIWHLSDPPMPGWLGVSTGSWLGIFHGATIGLTLLIAYGYYVFWQEGKQR